MPVRKKARKKSPRMDEDTMVALALSRSLLEQEKERERDREEERRIQAQLASGTSVTAPVLRGRAGAGELSVPYCVHITTWKSTKLVRPNVVPFKLKSNTWIFSYPRLNAQV